MNGSCAFPAAIEQRLPQSALLHDGYTPRDGGRRTVSNAGPARAVDSGTANHRQVNHAAAARAPASVTLHPLSRRPGSPPPGADEAFDASPSALTVENASNISGPQV